MSRSLFVLLPLLALASCTAADEAGDGGNDESPPVGLGPADGHDLPPTDLERVVAGDLAPDFSLVSLAGPVVTLSDYRGEKNVILVFYRGWW